MTKEIITIKQAVSLIFLFIVGTPVIHTLGIEAKHDILLANILAIIFMFPMILIYSTLNSQFHGHDLFDILEICFGKYLGKVMTLLYIGFTTLLACKILRILVEFINIISLQNTPIVILLACFSILAAWVVKKGIKVLGQFSEFLFIILSAFMIIIMSSSIHMMNLDNIRPVLYEGINPVFQGSFSVITRALGELIIFTMLFSNFKKKKDCNKIYIIGFFIASFFLIATSMTDVAILGVEHIEGLYFPSYSLFKRVFTGAVHGLEVFGTSMHIIGGFTAISICFIVICKGLTKIFSFNDYGFLVSPVAFLITNLSYLSFSGIMELNKYSSEIWPYLAFPFEIILPIIILITAKIKKRSKLSQ